MTAAGIMGGVVARASDGQSPGTVGDVLGDLPLFSKLAPTQLDHVVAGSRPVELPRGKILFFAGDPCDAFFAVARGQMKLTLSAPDGGEKVLEIISAGETFGEAVMFAGRPYPVTATALVHTHLVVIPAALVLDLVEADTLFARRMLAGMAQRLHAMVNDVEAISLRTATQRVVGLLLNLAGEHPAPGTTVALPSGKAVVASRLSLKPETFSRTLHQLADEGLLAVDGSRITLLDPSRLASALQ